MSFRSSLLLTIVPLVAIATGVVALVSHVYDRRVAERVSATMPQAEVMDLLAEQRRWHLILVIVLIALAAGVAVWLAGRVSRPLRHLQKQADAVASGRQVTAIPEDGPAELRALAADFNAMAAAVAAREADLARSQAVFRGLFDYTSDLVTLFRVPPAGPLVCDDLNPATVAATGYSRAHAIGSTFHASLPKDEADWLEARFREAAATGRPVSYERKIMLKGAERWFHTVVVPLPGPDGRVEQVASVSRDLTEHRQAAEALRDSEAFLAGLVEAATDAIVAVDDQDTVLLFNAAAERLFGVPAEQAFGKPVGGLLPGGLSGPSGARRVDARRHDGTPFVAELSTFTLEAAGRNVCAAIVREASA